MIGNEKNKKLKSQGKRENLQDRSFLKYTINTLLYHLKIYFIRKQIKYIKNLIKFCKIFLIIR